MANLVVALLGQSNACGLGVNAELDAGTLAAITALSGKVKVYIGGNADAGVKGSWLDLASGMGYTATQFGPEIGLGLALNKAYPSDTIYIIKHGEGSTDLAHDWLPPAGGSWVAGTATIAAALAGVASPVPIGCVWVQGETEARYSSADALAYGANLLTLIDAVRTATSTPRLPFVSAMIQETIGSPYDAWCPRVRMGEVYSTRLRALTYASDTHGLTYQDGVHYDSASVLALGARLASPLQGRSSRPLVAAPGRALESVAYCPSGLMTSRQISIADHADLRPRDQSWAIGFWVKQQPHAAQPFWTWKDSNFRPLLGLATGEIASYINDGAHSSLVYGTAKVRDLWDFVWVRFDRTSGRHELFRNLTMIADGAVGSVGDCNTTGALLVGATDAVAGDVKFNDMVWRKGGCWSWDDVRRYLDHGIAIPSGGTAQIKWGMREGSGTTITSVPSGYNGTLSSAGWSTLTRCKARATA